MLELTHYFDIGIASGLFYYVFRFRQIDVEVKSMQEILHSISQKVAHIEGRLSPAQR